MRRHGGEHGLGGYAQSIGLRNGRPFVADAEPKQAILALRDDPEIAARMAGELTRENANFLSRRLGRAPAAGELYAAHVLGAGGAARLIEAAAAGARDASAIFPREAGANRGLFFAHGAPVSAAALLERFGAATSPASAAAPAAEEESGVTQISPTLAHALFEFALLPLLRSDAEEERDLARAAYRRAQDL